LADDRAKMGERLEKFVIPVLGLKENEREKRDSREKTYEITSSKGSWGGRRGNQGFIISMGD